MAVTASYRNSYSTIATQSTFNFASSDIGTAAADRIVVVGIAASGQVGDTTISSATINGVSATVVSGADISFTMFAAHVAMVYAVVPTGTTGTISVTFSGNKGRVAISVWAVYGAAATHTDQDEAGVLSPTAAVALTSLTIPTDGMAFVMAGSSNNATTGCAWTNATERSDATVNNERYSGADRATAGTTTITATYSGTAPGELGAVGLCFGPGSTAYSLVCALGTFTLSGIAAGALLARKVIAAVGSFTLSGIAAIPKQARKMAADLGTFTLAGIAATLLKGARLSCAAGAFTLTGVAALFHVTLRMLAAVGTFTLSGIAALPKQARKIAAAVGTFTLSGVAAILKAARRMTAAVGTFSLTGIAATLLKGARLACATGAFTLTGIAVALLIPGLAILASAGSFVVSEGVRPILVWAEAAQHAVVGRIKEKLTVARQKAPKLFKARVR